MLLHPKGDARECPCRETNEPQCTVCFHRHTPNAACVFPVPPEMNR